MDKFDETIKNVRQDHEPNENFVEVTMKHVNEQHPKKRKYFKVWAPALMGGLAVLAVIFVALPGGSNKAVKSRSSNDTASHQQSQANQASANGSITAGTNNATLTSDLSSINSSIQQENADQNSANSALNDQSQQITVPTD